MSLDARTAPLGAGPRWITSEASRADVQIWRARSSAVLTGSGTVRSDDPRLNVRLSYGPWVRQPLRVVLDTALSCAPQAKIFQDGGALIFAAADAPETLPSGAAVVRVARGAGGLNLAAIVQCLNDRQVNELLVECGPRLAAAFVARELVDEWVLYVAPSVLGADAAPLLQLNAAAAQALQRFEFQDVQRCGDDLRLILKQKNH